MAQTNIPAPSADTRAIHFCFEWCEALTRRELEFVASLLWQPWRLTPKQQSELDWLVEKCRRTAAAGVV